MTHDEPSRPGHAVPHAGDLELRPLPAVLLDLHDARATGRFLVRRDRVVKTVELFEGALVSGSGRDDTLGHFLVASGVITQAQHQAAVAAVAATPASAGKTVADALIELGVMTPQALVDQLGAQTRFRLMSPLRWPSGAWRFEARHVDLGPLLLPVPDTVLTGLRDTATEGVAPHVLLADVFLELTPRGQRLVPLIRTLYGARVPDRLPEGVTARGLIEQGIAAAVVDALVLTDAVVPAIPRVGPALSLRSGDTGERSPLFDELFGGLSTVAPLPTGGDPLDLGDDLLDDDLLDDDATRAARQALHAEVFRIRDLDHYAVLMVDATAGDLEIAAALAERQSQFSRDYYARFQLGADASLLDDLHAAYQSARDTLLSDRRIAYDKELAGGELTETGVEAERLRAAGLELLRRGDADAACEKLEAAVALKGKDAEALAGLGWAVWHREERSAEGADVARSYLARALRAQPELGVAHQYLGLIELAVGVDEHAALDHLERAARVLPGETTVLDAIAAIYQRRGQPRGLERAYRRLLRAGAGTPHDQAILWQRLATLYGDHLDDPHAAKDAYAHAARLGGSARPPRKPAPAAAPRGSDADLVAAMVRIASGDETEADRALYDERRPRMLPRARKTMSRELWHLLAHPDDEADVGALAELLAPAIQALHPVTLADLAADPAARLPDESLPPAFRGLRDYCAELLGLPPAPVYAHPDFGGDVHVGATGELVLLAGDDALTAPDRPELGFRIARATTYLWPGRAAGASRPARVLRGLILSLFREVTAASDDGGEEPVRAALAALDPTVREQARALVSRLLARAPDHNLTRWAQSLGRTADRFGLVVCGDVPVARRLAEGDGHDLLEFAASPAFLELRAALGLTVDR